MDGPEDRNSRLNYDEIRFWADYTVPSRSRYIDDDQRRFSGLTPGDPFVIVSDQHADPFDADSIPGAIQELRQYPLVKIRETPDGEGAVEQNILQDAVNLLHQGDSAFDTADFADAYGPFPDFGGVPSNLRADYVLPRKQLCMIDAGVFWPTAEDSLFALVGTWPFPRSDHRLVWVDVRVPNY